MKPLEDKVFEASTLNIGEKLSRRKRGRANRGKSNGSN